MLRNSSISRLGGRFVWVGCSTLALCWAGAAQAQAAAPQAVEAQPAEATALSQTDPAPGAPQAASQGGGGDIIVTGSRLSENGFKAPTPVTVVTAATLKSTKPDNLADALNELPQFHGSTRSNQGGGGGASGGTNGQNLLNLRALGPERNLVLLNGHRLPPSNQSGSVNINVIPDALVQRVDVVTGGASAAYGSDAVAGVVNFVLDTRFSGVKMEGYGGITTYGDSQTGKFSAAIGKQDMLDGRLRFVASGSYFHQSGIPVTKKNGRDWFDNPYGRYTCSVAVCGFANFIGRNPQSSTGSAGGTITAINSSQGTVGQVIRTGPLAELQFGPNGTLIPFVLGQDVGSQYMIGGGSGINLNNALSPTQDRLNFFAHAEIDLSDHATFYIEGLYSRDKSEAAGLLDETLNSQGQFTIYGDNAYLPDSVKALLPANQVGQNVPVFGLSRINVETPVGTNLNLTTLKRVTAGVQGKISSRWKYDASFAYSDSFQNLTEYNLFNARNFYGGVDAVRDATGKIVCRSNLNGGNPGCVPIDVFGPGAISADGINYLVGHEDQNSGRLSIKQIVIDANISGDFGDAFSLGAGPISIAAGFDYRREDFNKTVDPLSAAIADYTGIQGVAPAYNYPGRRGAFTFYNPQPYSGVTSATEGYVEVGVPLLRDKSFAKQLDLNGALRLTDYNLSGMVKTYKAGLTWQINDTLRLRGAYSQDIRAPNAGELFNAGAQTQNNQIFPCSYCSNAFTRNSTTLAVGNLNLKPEIAHTVTLGAIFTPHFIRGFSFSADYYDIRIRDFIGDAGVAMDACFQGDPAGCARISINGVPITNINQVTPSTTGVQILIPQVNIANRRVSGLDFETNYRLPLGSGTLTAHAFANVALHNINSSSVFPEAVGILGSPHWSGQASLRWENKDFSVGVQERLLGPATNFANLTEGVNVNCCNHTNTFSYTDLNFSYKYELLGAKQEIFFIVTNIFNPDPPIAPGNATNYVSNTNYGDYDAIGRRFTLGIRAKF